MKKKNKKQKRLNKHLSPYLFLAPWLIGFIIFTLIPFFYTFYLSFNNVNQTGLGFKLTWVGFNNYYNMFFSSIKYIPALINFIIMQVLYVPVILVISFILGLLLNQEFKFRTTFRTIFFLPVIILSGSVLQQFMTSGATAFATVSDLFVFRMVVNYSRPLARAIEILFINFTIVLWFTGIPIILYINAFQKIDRGLFEAAEIDGASWWQMIWKIIIPNVKTTSLVVCIYTIINLGLFNINPRADGTEPIYTLIVDAIRKTSTGLGVASAYAVMYTLVILILIGLSMFIFRDRHKMKKIESLQERQVKKLRRIQKWNRFQELTFKEYFTQLFAKLKKKGGDR